MKTEEYVRAMRLALCAEEVRDERGDLNHAYFLSKKNCYWGKVQEKALLEALAKHPVGDWAQFRIRSGPVRTFSSGTAAMSWRA